MDEFITRWQFTRSETLEILYSLSDDQLQFKPAGETWQTLFHQFGCIGRAQLVYADAVRNGKMNFSLFGSTELPSKDENQTVESIAAFLNHANTEWLEALANYHGTIEWPDGAKSAMVHVMSLAEHERLHHGQLISYFTHAGLTLPDGFRRNWAL